MRYERLCAGGFRLGSRRFCLGSNTPRALFGKQCECTGKVVRKLFDGGVHGEMESYSLPAFQHFCLSGRGRSPGFLWHPPVDTFQRHVEIYTYDDTIRVDPPQ